MNNKGALVTYLIGGAIAIALLFIILFFVVPSFGQIEDFIENIIPGFNRSVQDFEGSELVGLRLDGESDERYPLMYFTGSEWREIGVSFDEQEKKKLIINDKEFDALDLWSEIFSFYFGSERKPGISDSAAEGTHDEPLFVVSNELGDKRFLAIVGSVNKFPGLDAFRYDSLILQKLTYDTGFERGECFLLDRFSRLSRSSCGIRDDVSSGDLVNEADYLSAAGNVNTWRSQILEGQEAEKLIQIEYVENDREIRESFSAQKVDSFLVVNLGESVSSSIEKYGSYEYLGSDIVSKKDILYSLENGQFYFSGEEIPVRIDNGKIISDVSVSGELEEGVVGEIVDGKIEIELFSYAGPGSVFLHLRSLNGREVDSF